MMVYDRNTAISMIGTVLMDHDLVVDQGLHNPSPARNARSQAASLLDEYEQRDGEFDEDVPARTVQGIISDILDEVEYRTGNRPEMPAAFSGFSC